MIAIDDFIDSLKISSGVNVLLGPTDFGPGEYPAIQVTLDRDMSFTSFNTHASTLFVGANIKIVNSRDGERKSLDILEKTLAMINQYDCEKGNRVGTRTDNITTGTITAEYTDNTYEITIPYSIQQAIQDTGV